MVRIKRYGVLLEPTQRDFENLAVFNPGAWKEGETVHLLYRGMDQEHRSSIGYARLQGPTALVERWDKPIISREFNYESKGIEDPRIVKIDNLFYVFYVAHDGKNALTACALSDNLRTFHKKGIISAQIPYTEAEQIFKEAGLKDEYHHFASFYKEMAGIDVLVWGKDIFLFPKKINGKFALLHRILPGIQIAFFDDLEDLTEEFWREHFRNLPQYTILEKECWFESSHIGGGCPPIETEEGWLLIFHATEKKETGEKIYHASAALLDKKNPLKLLSRLKEPLFSPEEEWETSGVVPNVVFPTGTALFNGELYIYYGAADTRVAVASVNIQELVKELKKTPNNNA